MVAQWERICLQCRRCGFYPWIRKIPWRRKWQPIPLFLPGKFYGQRSLVGYSLWRYTESNYNWDACTYFTSKLDQKCGEAWVSGLTVLHLAQWHAPPVAVQSLRCVQFFETPWTAAHQASLYFTISWSLPKLRCIESAMPSNHLILCCSLLLLPSIFPSIRVFSKESALCINGQSIGVLASKAVLLMSIQGWFPLGLTGLISMQSKGLSRVFSSTIQKHHPRRPINICWIINRWRNEWMDSSRDTLAYPQNNRTPHAEKILDWVERNNGAQFQWLMVTVYRLGNWSSNSWDLLGNSTGVSSHL